MPKINKISSSHKDLIARYLTWAYKSTKESFDRLERKTTQLMADEFILAHVSKNKKAKVSDPAYKALVDKYKDYIDAKKAQPIDAAQYAYLEHRLEAIEAAIKHFLGPKAMQQIHKSYSQEFTRRIWESKDH